MPNLFASVFVTYILATGAGEAVINPWHDSTATDIVDAAKKDDEVVYVRKYNAKDQVQKALGIRERNTKPKLFHIAQFIQFQGFCLTEILATSGSEAIINLWHDSTATDIVEAFEKEDEVVFVRKYDVKDQVQKALGGFCLIYILATGGGEAVINLWHDSTATYIAKAAVKEARLLVMVGCLEANALVRNYELLIDRRKHGDDQLGVLTARYESVKAFYRVFTANLLKNLSTAPITFIVDAKCVEIAKIDNLTNSCGI
uniref:Uncharacterized protein n=1 Tax=Tanacetum cinerariifolium TaxID=118510 RepID=A0A6L2K491_TANCI|nr:hypothetical protein [Tanacetum cinerariifolium]